MGAPSEHGEFVKKKYYAYDAYGNQRKLGFIMTLLLKLYKKVKNS